MQSYYVPQAQLVNLNADQVFQQQLQLQQMSGEFDKTMQSIQALAPIIGKAAVEGHNGYSLMKDKSMPELTDAQKIMMIISSAMPVVAEGAQAGTDVYSIWKKKQAAQAAAARYPHPQPNLNKVQDPSEIQLMNMSGEFDKTMQSIAALTPIIQKAAEQGHTGYALMKDKSMPELTDAQKIMMIIANAMPVVAEGAQAGTDVYSIWKKKQAAQAAAAGHPTQPILNQVQNPNVIALQSLNGEFDKTMQSIAALTPIIQKAAEQGHIGYSLMKDKSNPELTDAQKIMMIIANAMPVVAEGAQAGTDVYSIWKKKQAAQAAAAGYTQPHAAPQSVPLSQAAINPQGAPMLGKVQDPNELSFMLI